MAVLLTALPPRAAGVGSLYSGLSTNLTTSAPISAIYTSTYEAVKDSFQFRCIGEHQPKGISRRVTAYEVIGR